MAAVGVGALFLTSMLVLGMVELGAFAVLLAIVLPMIVMQFIISKVKLNFYSISLVISAAKTKISNFMISYFLILLKLQWRLQLQLKSKQNLE